MIEDKCDLMKGQKGLTRRMSLGRGGKSNSQFQVDASILLLEENSLSRSLEFNFIWRKISLLMERTFSDPPFFPFQVKTSN